MSGCGGAPPKPPEQPLKRLPSFVLASLRGSTYRKGTPRLLASLENRLSGCANR
jgi:hypothetical protein